MWGYVLRRVVLIIPTLLIIAVLSFFLQSLTPGDVVADRLTIEGTSIYNSKDSYDQAYKRLENQMGLDRPKFYFGVLPSYFPDTLYRVFPKQKRISSTTILRQVKNWKQVEEFYKALSLARSTLENSETTSSGLLSVINKIEVEKDLSSVLSRKGEMLSEIEKAEIHNSAEIHILMSLVSSLDELKTENSFSWPTLRWFGSQNQFHYWLTHLFSKKNTSVVDGAPVGTKISRALSWTVSLGLISLILIGILALVIAYLQVYYAGGWLDKVLSGLWYFLLAMPTFWFATLMVVFFTTPEYGSWTDVFPSIGIKPAFIEKSFISELLDNSAQLILPIFCITILSLAYLVIQTKSDLTRVLSEPYMKASRSRGLSFAMNLKQHALPNALLTYITILSGAIPSIFTGSVIIEVIFNIPGVGRLLLYSVQQQDWPVVFSIVIVISLVTVMSYILGDIILMWLYPKTRSSFNITNT